ncbi:MAG: RpiB/LacA/LacB family sugar-phosphate isomerase, partial [Armatimonadota bacterium]|nr:RpiB/LacA/LacB family sugar-phosphate isomerase [Armatimonadota bacterium]
LYSAMVSRTHNDSNILTLGERVIGVGIAIEIVKTWLFTEFSGEERHAKRIAKIKEIERKFFKEAG